jgi:hypothetical protein
LFVSFEFDPVSEQGTVFAVGAKQSNEPRQSRKAILLLLRPFMACYAMGWVAMPPIFR